MQLYELTDELISIERLMEDESVDDMEINQKLAVYFKNLDKAADDVGKLIMSLNAEDKALKDEVDRLNAKRKAAQRKMDWFKSYLQDVMMASKRKSIKTDLFSFRIQKNKPSLKINSEKDIPEEYYRTERILQKKLLLDEIKNAGVYVEGVEVVQTEGLRIR